MLWFKLGMLKSRSTCFQMLEVGVKVAMTNCQWLLKHRCLGLWLLVRAGKLASFIKAYFWKSNTDWPWHSEELAL
eukprot:4818141-Amphidinium_carterae.1